MFSSRNYPVTSLVFSPECSLSLCNIDVPRSFHIFKSQFPFGLIVPSSVALCLLLLSSKEKLGHTTDPYLETSSAKRPSSSFTNSVFHETLEHNGQVLCHLMKRIASSPVSRDFSSFHPKRHQKHLTVFPASDLFFKARWAFPNRCFITPSPHPLPSSKATSSLAPKISITLPRLPKQHATAGWPRQIDFLTAVEAGSPSPRC